MRIAVNASSYDRRPSGLGIYARELVIALSQLHPDLVVYTSRVEDLPKGRAISRLGESSRRLPGHLWRLGWSQTMLPLRSALTRADILLNTFPEGPLRSWIPQVTVVHDILPLFFPDELPRLQWYFHVFVPAVLRVSVAVIADSAQTREDVLTHYGLDPERVFTIVPGVNAARFFPRPVAADIAGEFGLRRYLLYVGNLLPHKNLGRLLEAFAQVRGDVSLAVAGYRHQRYWPPLARRAEELGIATRVRFLDFVSDDALSTLYGGALAAVVPSLYEGFGLPVLEAMASGVPVVASTVGGLREAVGNAALTVDPLDVSALTAALQRVTDDPALRASLRERGIAHAARFRWDETARNVLRVLEGVVAAPSSVDVRPTTSEDRRA